MVIDAGPTCPVRILVTLGKDAELPEWRIEAEMPEGWVITESEFPRIAVNRPEGAKEFFLSDSGPNTQSAMKDNCNHVILRVQAQCN